MELKTAEELKDEARKTIQIVLSPHLNGLDINEFDNTRQIVRPIKLEKYLHLGNFKTVRELYEKWFSDVIRFEGGFIKCISAARLAGDQENLKHIYDLNLRTKTKEGKSKKSGRRGKAGGPSGPTSRRRPLNSFTTQYRQPQYPPPLLNQSPFNETSCPPGFDNRRNSYNNEYIPQYSDPYYSANTYDGPDPFYDAPLDNDLRSNYSQNNMEDDYGSVQYSTNTEESSMPYEETLAEKAFYDYMDSSSNIPKKQFVRTILTSLSDDIYKYAVQIENVDKFRFLDGRYVCNEIDSTRYFETVLTSIYNLLDPNQPQPFHFILLRMSFQLDSRVGRGPVDVYKLMQTVFKHFFVFEESMQENIPIFEVKRSPNSAVELLRQECHDRIYEIPYNLDDSKEHKLKIFGSKNVEYPYYLVIGNNQRLINDLKTVTLRNPSTCYPWMYCIVTDNNINYRGRLITFEDFESGDVEHVLVELIDAGTTLSKSLNEIYEIPNSLLTYQRYAVLAKPDIDCKGFIMEINENDPFKRLSSRGYVRLYTKNDGANIIFNVA